MVSLRREAARARKASRPPPITSPGRFCPLGPLALERFNAAPPSALEQREKLEQLRALELGLRIWAARIDKPPISVDTPDDLARARAAAEAP